MPASCFASSLEPARCRPSTNAAAVSWPVPSVSAAARGGGGRRVDRRHHNRRVVVAVGLASVSWLRGMVTARGGVDIGFCGVVQDGTYAVVAETLHHRHEVALALAATKVPEK